MTGATQLHILSGGRLRMRLSTYLPAADRAEMVEVPCPCSLVRHRQGNVLFDTGCHPSVATDAQARWGGVAKSITPVLAPGESVLAELARLDLGPDDIDVVVNSHLHMDHCGCNEFFKRASFIVHARELETAADPASEGRGYFRADWDQPTAFDTIEGERDLFGDGAMVLVPMPGHTPGTVSALVALEKTGPMLLASDAVNMRANLDQDIVSRNMWDAELTLRSLAEIRRIEASGALVICGHDPEQWGQLKTGADFYA